jgi:hypothetical protein
MDAIAQLLRSKDPNAQREASNRLASLGSELESITQEYEMLWRARNKRDGLDYNLRRLRRQAVELSRLQAAAETSALRIWSPGQPRESQPTPPQ